MGAALKLVRNAPSADEAIDGPEIIVLSRKKLVKVETVCLGCDEKFKTPDPKRIRICANCKKLERWKFGG